MWKWFVFQLRSLCKHMKKIFCFLLSSKGSKSYLIPRFFKVYISKPNRKMVAETQSEFFAVVEVVFAYKPCTFIMKRSLMYPVFSSANFSWRKFSGLNGKLTRKKESVFSWIWSCAIVQSTSLLGFLNIFSNLFNPSSSTIPRIFSGEKMRLFTS